MAKSRQDLEGDIQNLLGLLQQTREQLDQLNTQAELLRISLEEHRTAIDTLDAYKGVKEGHEVLVPVGANAYVFATSGSTKAAITEIGAGLSAALPIEVAVEKLQKRIEKIDGSRKKVLEGASRLEQSVASIENQVQGLYGQLQGTAPPGRAPARAQHTHSRKSDEDEEAED
ncbi:MAG TPA: prefoldin subunit alpha [Candidatus Thermoplasmatota archaeon]|nr:prefoldin subunit alpha [Candidatus Thermoplasmatota archaeon]